MTIAALRTSLCPFLLNVFNLRVLSVKISAASMACYYGYTGFEDSLWIYKRNLTDAVVVNFSPGPKRNMPVDVMTTDQKAYVRKIFSVFWRRVLMASLLVLFLKPFLCTSFYLELQRVKAQTETKERCAQERFVCKCSVPAQSATPCTASPCHTLSLPKPQTLNYTENNADFTQCKEN